MESPDTAGGARPPHVSHQSMTFGLSAAGIRLRYDEHGAAYIHLDADDSMSIRIEVRMGRYDTPGAHAAALERDRQGLLHLAELAVDLAQHIEQRQETGGAS